MHHMSYNNKPNLLLQPHLLLATTSPFSNHSYLLVTNISPSSTAYTILANILIISFSICHHIFYLIYHISYFVCIKFFILYFYKIIIIFILSGACCTPWWRRRRVWSAARYRPSSSRSVILKIFIILIYWRGINTEEKTKVVAALWGTEFIPFLVSAVLH